jgi:hypothetical protein
MHSQIYASRKARTSYNLEWRESFCFLYYNRSVISYDISLTYSDTEHYSSLRSRKRDVAQSYSREEIKQAHYHIKDIF